MVGAQREGATTRYGAHERDLKVMFIGGARLAQR